MITLTDYLETQYMDALNKLPEESPKITSELLEQYKEIVTTTLLQQFGLGKLVKFKDGGNVTTLHNARRDTFANEEDERRFKNPYNKDTRKQIYEKDFKQNRKKEFQNNSHIYDGYTGTELKKDGRAQKDHIIAAATIHKNDEARLYMSDKQRGAMAVDKKNLTWAEASMNQSKGEHDLMEWMEFTSSKYPDMKNKDRFDIDEQMAKEKYDTAKQHVEQSVKDAKKEYYKKNIKETGIKQGTQMAKRQALGIFLFELQNAFFSEMGFYFRQFKTYENNSAKLNAFKEACQNVKKRVLSFNSLKKVFVGYTEGFVSGFVSNLITVLINTFARTSKNIIRIITEGTNGLVQAIRMILFPPEDMTRKQAIYEGSKIIVAAVITAFGVIITEAFINYLMTIPPLIPFASLIGGILGGILTGIVSVTVIYAMDNFGLIMQKINVRMKEITYYTIVSTEQLRERYNTAIAKIDSAYNEILNKIFAEYESLNILTNNAYDFKFNSSERFNHSKKLASALNVDGDEILKSDKDILAFFTE
ncbi:hypothetical protein [Sporolactobacillus laevolacticus]|uniref:hypothetical protein n=1 Tax=Sporolactobacillus laevolacticus TaxID=33018 RepID=UPI0025B34A24|nr:hypothetical protein [Sporolactobacillus laevolacticus]MDN3956165.1 hypothetical protein [Sporolactobacillus laevolacticus]